MKNLIELRRTNVNPLDFFDDFYTDLNSLFDNKNQDHGVRCELSQKDEHFIVSLDTPGVAREDISIEVEDGVLVVKAFRKKLTENISYSERQYGSFERRIALPKEFDSEKIQAHYDNGVLSVAIGKLEKPEPKKIEITNEKQGIWDNLLTQEDKEVVQKS